MKLLNKITAVGMLAFAPACFSAVGSGEFNILKVEVTETFFTVYSASGAITNDTCEDGSKVVFWRTDYPNGYDSMLSVALAAHMSNRKVTMWLDGCKPGPWGKTLPKAGSIVVTGN
ncbi:hypothetical protein [Shewanella algae]|uniref:hypothetical protein n=1 Tax=Shewanella algae TaxID=38313 RepID=UPI0031F59E42